MAQKIINEQKCLAELKKAGAKIDSPLIGILVKGGLTEKNLAGCVNFANIVGADNFQSFLYNAQNADVFSRRKLSDRQKTIILIRAFSPAFKKLFSDNSLKQAGSLRIVDGSKPFNFAIEISKRDSHNPYFALSFDLKVSDTGRAAITIGNFHVLNPAIAIKEQAAGLNNRIADVAINSFIRCFKSKSVSVVAANTRQHLDYQHPSVEVVITKLKMRGVISSDDAADFYSTKEYVDLKSESEGFSKLGYLKSLKGKTRGSPFGQRVAALVRAEIEKIRYAGTVSHKIAYKKAGFKTKGRIQRIAGVRLTKNGKMPKKITPRNIILSPTKKPLPYWGLASRKKNKR